MMETERLFLRPFSREDAEAVYRLARDPEVGPCAGWKPHRSEEETAEIIETILSAPECYAVCLKGTGKPVGAVELILYGRSALAGREDECELGYWLGRPFWGMGLMSEAAKTLLRRAFTQLDMCAVWCCSRIENERSRRLQERIGFVYQRTVCDAEIPALGEKWTEQVSLLSKERWMKMEDWTR